MAKHEASGTWQQLYCRLSLTHLFSLSYNPRFHRRLNIQGKAWVGALQVPSTINVTIYLQSRQSYGPGSTCTRLAQAKVQKWPCSLNMWCHYLVTDCCFWSLYQKVGDCYLRSSSRSRKPLLPQPQVDPEVFKGPGACFPRHPSCPVLLLWSSNTEQATATAYMKKITTSWLFRRRKRRGLGEVLRSWEILSI